jgi:hypothetical protein
MSARKIRRAADHAARKAARKAARQTGFPNPATLPSALTPSSAAAEPVVETAPPISKISPARLAANRANSLLSKGATSEIGRAISSQNHTTHGLARHNGAFQLLTSEDPAGFEALKQRLASEHQPTTETEAIFINTMAESHWLAHRAHRLAQTFINLDTGLIENEKSYNLYLRYETAHNRAFRQAFHDLLKLRSERRKEHLGFEAQERKDKECEMKIEKHELEAEDQRLSLFLRDPLVSADSYRIGQAAASGSADFDRLKAEFKTNYLPNYRGPVAA